MVITASHPVLVIMSLSEGNALAKKGAAHTSYNGPPEKDCMYNSQGWLPDKIKCYKTYGPF